MKITNGGKELTHHALISAPRLGRGRAASELIRLLAQKTERRRGRGECQTLSKKLGHRVLPPVVTNAWCSDTGSGSPALAVTTSLLFNRGQDIQASRLAQRRK